MKRNPVQCPPHHDDCEQSCLLRLEAVDSFDCRDRPDMHGHLLIGSFGVSIETLCSPHYR